MKAKGNHYFELVWNEERLKRIRSVGSKRVSRWRKRQKLKLDDIRSILTAEQVVEIERRASLR